MKVICMYCKTCLGEKPGEEKNSDTICSKCIPLQCSDLFDPDEIAQMIIKEEAYEASLKKS